MQNRSENECANDEKLRRLLEDAVRRAVGELREDPSSLLREWGLPQLEQADFESLAAPLSEREAAAYLPELEDEVSGASPEELAEEVARELLRARLIHGTPAAPAPRPSRRRSVVVQGGEGERAYLEELRRRDAERAGKLELVQLFREQVLGGRLLTPEDVLPWLEERDALRSPGALEQGIVAAVPAQLAGEEGPEPSGPPRLLAAYPLVRVALPPGAGGGDGFELGEFSAPAATAPLLVLKAAAEEVEEEVGWEESLAALFVLTGIVPRYEAARAEWYVRFGVVQVQEGNYVLTDGVGRGARVTIRTWSFVAPQRVDEAFRKARRMLGSSRARRRREEQGRRTPTERSRALYAFVRETPGLAWAERLERWNERHPHWRYKFVSNMRTAYARARKSIEEG